MNIERPVIKVYDSLESAIMSQIEKNGSSLLKDVKISKPLEKDTVSLSKSGNLLNNKKIRSGMSMEEFQADCRETFKYLSKVMSENERVFAKYTGLGK